MERIIVNYKDGRVQEFAEPTAQIISGNSLIITIKKTITGDNETDIYIATNTDVIDLSEIKNFVKITPTRKINIEAHVSDK